MDNDVNYELYNVTYLNDRCEVLNKENKDIKERYDRLKEKYDNIKKKENSKFKPFLCCYK